MKIKIVDWDKFEKTNAIYFTRDTNQIDEFEVWAMFLDKGKKVMLVYLNFVTYNCLSFIDEGDYYIILDNLFDETFHKAERHISTYLDDGIKVKLLMKKAVGKKWMFDNKEFFAMAAVNRKKAEEIFLHNEFNL